MQQQPNHTEYEVVYRLYLANSISANGIQRLQGTEINYGNKHILYSRTSKIDQQICNSGTIFHLIRTYTVRSVI
jgi:hypothetical protein